MTPDDASALEDIQAFIESTGTNWLQGYGAAATIERLGVDGFPTVLVFGKDGKVVWHDLMIGSVHDAIASALAE